MNAKLHPGEGRGLAALVSGAVCIAFAAVWVRWSEVGPIATAFHRLAIALPALALWMRWERVPVSPAGGAGIGDQVSSGEDARAAWGWIVAAGVFFAFDLAAWHESIRLTTVANATLLGNFAPIFVTLGAWLFLRERVGFSFVVGMATALVGAWLLTGARFEAGSESRFRGDLLGLLTAVFYGGYQLSVARLRRSLPAGRILFSSSVVCAVALAVMARMFGESLVPPTPRAWMVLVGLALTAQVMGQGLITYGFAHLPAGFSSLTLLVQPVVAALAGWWLFDERLDARRGIGAAIVLLGLLLARRQTVTSRRG